MVLKNNSYEPIVKIHEGTKRSIIDHNNPNRGSYFHPEWMFNYLSTTVVDKDTHQVAPWHAHDKFGVARAVRQTSAANLQ